MKTERRPKPSIINVAEELGFGNNRIPDVGPGSHKPNRGRGGVPLTNQDEYYDVVNDLKDLKMKKGLGIGAQEKEKKAEKPGTEKPKWSEIV